MPDVALAALGGSVGVLLTWAARSLGIPSDVRAHDAAVTDRDDQLATWIADTDYTLRRDTDARGASAAARRPDLVEDDGYGNLSSWRSAALGTDKEIAAARTQALHRYRDEARLAHLDVAQILATEGWGHRAYRRVTRRPAPLLNAPDRARPVLDRWRAPSAISGEAVAVDDATARTLDDALQAAQLPSGE